MTHANLVANELQQVGFKTIVTQTNDHAVAVSLKNRTVNTTEVKTALEQAFGEIEFNCTLRPYGVLVSW